nr:protein strawberry notch homolog 2-like [Vicugna pacos]
MPLRPGSRSRPMLAARPAMDGEFPQHEPPPAGSVLYQPAPLQAPLCGSGVQNAMLHCSWWSPFSPAAYPAFSSESHQFMNSSSFIVGQPCADTSYGPAAASPSFPPKSSDFPQDTSYLDDLSNASIFSSSVDSLSDIADTPDFLPADSLNQVPTIWDVSTGPSTHDKLFLPSGPFTGLEDPVSSLPSTPLLVSYQSQSQPEEEDEAEEDEAEELGHAETYADYVPSKCECPAGGKPQQATSGQHSLRQPALSGQGCRVPGAPEGSLPGYLKPQRQVWELRWFCDRGCHPCFPQIRRQAEAVAERQAAFPRLLRGRVLWVHRVHADRSRSRAPDKGPAGDLRALSLWDPPSFPQWSPASLVILMDEEGPLRVLGLFKAPTSQKQQQSHSASGCQATPLQPQPEKQQHEPEAQGCPLAPSQP